MLYQNNKEDAFFFIFTHVKIMCVYISFYILGFLLSMHVYC
jgi:hypothetical protein